MVVVIVDCPDMLTSMSLPFLLWPLSAGTKVYGCTEREWGQIVAFLLVSWAGWTMCCDGPDLGHVEPPEFGIPIRVRFR